VMFLYILFFVSLMRNESIYLSNMVDGEQSSSRKSIDLAQFC
jgi:hypothetical protein